MIVQPVSPRVMSPRGPRPMAGPSTPRWTQRNQAMPAGRLPSPAPIAVAPYRYSQWDSLCVWLCLVCVQSVGFSLCSVCVQSVGFSLCSVCVQSVGFSLCQSVQCVSGILCVTVFSVCEWDSLYVTLFNVSVGFLCHSVQCVCMCACVCVCVCVCVCCLLYTSPSPRDRLVSRMPSSA